tara:strand:- start:1933 stop:3198 length:1266 start_codon:yes stop_codon:yes gene_type:complete
MNRGYIVVSAGTLDYIPCCNFNVWLRCNAGTLVSPLPLGFILNERDITKLPAATRANIEAARLPLEKLVDGLDIAALAVRWAIDALESATEQLGGARKSLAEIRFQQELVQRNFVETESWLNAMLAPKFSLVREIPRGSGYIQLQVDQTIRLALPCSSRGLAAVDIYAGVKDGLGRCELSAQLVRWNGECIAAFDNIALTEKCGWARLRLPHGVSGDDEDCSVDLRCVSGDAEIGLALPVPFNHLRAFKNGCELAAPLALKIWGGLPGVGLPKIGKVSAALAASQISYLTSVDLPVPLALIGSYTTIQEQGSIELRPEPSGKALVVMRNVSLETDCDIEAFLQFLGDDGAVATFSTTLPGVIKVGTDSYRLPQGSFINATQLTRLADHARSPKVDIVLRLENAHPGSVIKLWALKLSRSRV